MLTIRLQRTGTKNKPSFRVVLAQAYRSASKQALEVLGHYNPKSKVFGVKDPERLKYWIAQHVKISPTVYNLLVEKKMVEGKKVKAWQPKKKEGEAAPASEAPKAETTPAPTEAPAPEAPKLEDAPVEPAA
ncbi:MAG TPA: 30S ribosomal protein S16 [Methylomirabilota bacterium]|jgi:small subunit ribosomal protein S16|nr:30S ribosomal protein S16 [Methylomirabilota bacterium]